MTHGEYKGMVRRCCCCCCCLFCFSIGHRCCCRCCCCRRRSCCYYCRCYYHHRRHLYLNHCCSLLLLLLLLWLLDYFLHCTLIIASIKIFVIGIFKNHPCFQKMPSTNQDPGPFDVNVSQQRFFFRSKIMGHSSHHFEELLGFSCCTEAQLK